MLFNSFEFGVFAILVFAVYWFVLKKSLKGQNLFLLVASYVFYGWWDWRFLSLIVFSSFVDFFVGIGLEKYSDQKRRKRLLALSVLVNLGLLGVFKYYNFFSENFQAAASSLGIQFDALTLNVVLPVGISFYTFQTMSYTIDVYRSKMRATKDPLAFFTYVAFFPQLVAGPIERAFHLLPQFNKSRKFDYAFAVSGGRLILWGFFKKVVIADNCARYVNEIFADYGALSGPELALGSVLFAFQIYGDFSGYSDIAIGVGRLLGFDLMTNFKMPYFSRDIAEFWRRWHISLSTWFRDYLYIPLGGSRLSKWLNIRNVFIIFLVSGFWHGANWTFIAWGALNALYFLPLLITKRNRKNLDTIGEQRLFPRVTELLSMSGTFVITCFAWIFFRSNTFSDAIAYIGQMINGPAFPETAQLFDVKLGVLILLLVVVDWLGRHEGIDSMLGNWNKGWRHSFYYLILICILVFGAFEETAFIYFQF